MTEELKDYLGNKNSFIFKETFSLTDPPTYPVKYKKGDVLIEQGQVNKLYIILGYLVSASGYIRYVGELRSYCGVLIQISSRSVSDVDSHYKLSLKSMFKKL
jgi:hypothetical protein